MSVWDQVNLVFYNVIPFLVMITFNTLLIINLKKKLSQRKNNKSNGPKSSSSASKRPGLTVSLVVLSFLFLIMTTPGTIMFAYFYDGFLSNLDTPIVFLIDDISFLNHAMLFFISFASNKKFRSTIIGILCRGRENSKTTNLNSSVTGIIKIN